MSETICFTVVFEGDVRAIKDNPFGIESPFGKPQQVMLGDVQDLIAEETEWADRTKKELDLVYEAIPLPFSLERPDGGAVSASKAVKKMAATIARLEAEVERLNTELSFALTDLNTARQDNASFGPEFKRLKAEVERKDAALRDAYEVYAGSDGFIPETAAEGYQQQIIKQMVGYISAALTPQEETNV
jgi:uncharacterized small protein (DUF1192 family)